MRKIVSASVLLTTLILASGLFAIIFLNKDFLLKQETISLGYYQQYLNDKYKLIDQISIDTESECAKQKSSSVTIEFKVIKYRFHCRFSSLFDPFKPTKEKYIQIDQIENWLNLAPYQKDIYYIHHLAELPDSSIDNPKIIIALQDINEKLEKDFYGIVITNHLFDLTGSKRMYGTLYSRYDNLREERNLSYKKEVIQHLEQKYSQWHYLPYSRNILANE
ncbi:MULTISPECIES: DUF2572 family protein [Glaesserella]|uniref:DUF2572 domain-containing protein n=1 Tax=Glaesserella australis TaxID=2094024 RepID=A0A328BYQ3_9PAST|nr:MULTISPECIES: DUF2572 family protein [Glaesserella]AUI66591.1 hypothetical protein CJD39_08405 [Glaesserella sp. 15-184]RAL18765.1 DUF2572 domain-containing protein [Glaesserella australis]